jgi:hypothetical protein
MTLFPADKEVETVLREKIVPTTEFFLKKKYLGTISKGEK